MGGWKRRHLNIPPGHSSPFLKGEALKFCSKSHTPLVKRGIFPKCFVLKRRLWEGNAILQGLGASEYIHYPLTLAMQSGGDWPIDMALGDGEAHRLVSIPEWRGREALFIICQGTGVCGPGNHQLQSLHLKEAKPPAVK